MEKISFGTMNWVRGRGEEGERKGLGGGAGGGQGRMRGHWTQEGREG